MIGLVFLTSEKRMNEGDDQHARILTPSMTKGSLRLRLNVVETLIRKFSALYTGDRSRDSCYIQIQYSIFNSYPAHGNRDMLSNFSIIPVIAFLLLVYRLRLLSFSCKTCFIQVLQNLTADCDGHGLHRTG